MTNMVKNEISTQTAKTRAGFFCSKHPAAN